MSLTNLFSRLKGGAGSGNIGHAGRVGHRGGSAPKTGGAFGGILNNSSTFSDSTFTDILSKMPSVSSQLKQLDISDTPPQWVLDKFGDRDMSGLQGLYDNGKIYVNTNHWLYGKGTKEDVSSTLLHEMSHLRFYQRTQDEDKEFRSVVGEIMYKYWEKEEVKLMFKYSMDSHESTGVANEFFPEIVTNYVHRPETMKKELPKTYTFAEKIMNTPSHKPW